MTRFSRQGRLTCICLEDVNKWKLDAYETSDRSFARPTGELFEDYVKRSIDDERATGRPYARHDTGKDGRYFIEY
ncbi:MAG: hypothetical protein QGH33_14270 [Pirellulaceae bacterium]|nr:hypothetical protein [Pirellulaceae bacterium]